MVDRDRNRDGQRHEADRAGPGIAIGREHTSTWGDDDAKTFGRVIEADNIGIDVTRAFTEVRRITRDDVGGGEHVGAGSKPAPAITPIERMSK